MKIILLFLAGLLIHACSSGTEPDQKNPRKFSWTSDTLYYPNSIQTMMSELWASSANDVYAIGHCDNSSGHLYHFDGKNWETIGLGGSDGGPVHAPFNINDIYGLSEEDIYIVGNKRPSGVRQSLIVHFNGTEWEEIEVPALGELFSVWGSSPDDIWAGGNHGTLFHYDGVQWSVENLPHQGYPDFDVSLNISSIIGYSSNLIFFFTYSVFPYGAHLNHIFTYESNNISFLDSVWHFDSYDLWRSPEDKMYRATSRGVYLRHDNTWEKISDECLALGIHGINDHNIFIVCSSYGKYRVMHFNGSDWFEFENLHREDVFYSDVFTVDDEVFVVGYTLGTWPSKTMIWRGK